MPCVWEVEFTDEFGSWWDELTEEQQEQVDAAVEVLQRRGPTLGRPLVDTIQGSDDNLKELRVSKGGALRVLFAFDPLRTAILLLGGDKTGNWSSWYQEAIPQAEELFAQHIQELKREGLI